MLNRGLLDSLLGSHIKAFCPHGYVADGTNHCAHFVGHLLNLGFGYTCAQAVPGRAALGGGANVRVHEIFARSGNPHELLECPTRGEGLIFVSERSNFERIQGRAALQNVPKKHIGVLLDGSVWHYSNTRHQVARETVAEFFYHYPRQSNALWIGTIPQEARLWQCVGR